MGPFETLDEDPPSRMATTSSYCQTCWAGTSLQRFLVMHWEVVSSYSRPLHSIGCKARPLSCLIILQTHLDCQSILPFYFLPLSYWFLFLFLFFQNCQREVIGRHVLGIDERRCANQNHDLLYILREELYQEGALGKTHT